MGLTIGEIMKSKYFRNFPILAGEKGLDKRVQAVVLFDAPDGYKWLRGREFIITTGYLFLENEELFEEVIEFLAKKNAAGMGIKVDRYLKKIPDRIIDMCNKYNFPLISLPYDLAWIDLINAANGVAINKYIIRINNTKKNAVSRIGLQKPETRVKAIAKDLGIELEKPVAVYDMFTEKTYRFSNGKTAAPEGILYSDLWEPSFDHKKEIVCDELKIFRMTNLENLDWDSWIAIPISVKNETIAFMVVWETDEKIDFYELFAIRLCYTLLSSIYEQIYFINSLEGKFQDEFVQSLIDKEFKSKEAIYNKAAMLDLNLRKSYNSVLIERSDADMHMYEMREKISQRIYNLFSRNDILFGLLEQNKLVMLCGIDKNSREFENELKEKCEVLLDHFEKDSGGGRFRCGIGNHVDDMAEIRKSYIESIKALNIGKHIYPGERIIPYRKLGPFGLLRMEAFSSEEIKGLSDVFAPILDRDDKEELMMTLKVYLETGCNYNSTGRQLYIHSNTVRYRIEKIQDLCNIDMKSPIERLKLEIVLKFI